MSSGHSKLPPGPRCLLFALAIGACEPVDGEDTRGRTETTTTTTATATATAATTTVTPTIYLGTGIAAWQNLPEGGSIELIAGFQGGWHVDISVRGEDLEPVDLWLHYQALDPETEEPLSFVTHALLSEDNIIRSDSGWSRLGDRIVFDIPGPDVVVDREICIVVTADSATWEGENRRCVTIVDQEP